MNDEGGAARLIDILDAFVVGAKYAISVGAAAATVGIIIGIVTLTGVGFKLSTIITGAAAISPSLFGSILPASLFDAKANDAVLHARDDRGRLHPARLRRPDDRELLIMVTIAAPALAMLGVPQLVSHFFVFYYGVLADITPPVALAAYAGASMAGADPFKTGNTAFRLGLAKALVPFVFVYSPSMLLVTKGFTWAEFIETTTGCIIGIVMLAVALTGYGLARLPNLERLWLGAASILVISPSRTATLVGLAMSVPVLLRQLAAWRAAQTAFAADETAGGETGEGLSMKERAAIAFMAGASLLLAAPAAQAAPCLIVTVTGAQGGPQAFQGQAGPGTLIRYGDDADNCSAVRLQFDAGRGTLLRLSQLDVLSSQLDAIFFTHMHNDHSEGFVDLLMHRWMLFPTSRKIDVVCSDDVASPLGFTISCRKFVADIADARSIPARSRSASARTRSGPPPGRPRSQTRGPSARRTKRKPYGPRATSRSARSAPLTSRAMRPIASTRRPAAS